MSCSLDKFGSELRHGGRNVALRLFGQIVDAGDFRVSLRNYSAAAPKKIRFTLLFSKLKINPP